MVVPLLVPRYAPPGALFPTGALKPLTPFSYLSFHVMKEMPLVLDKRLKMSSIGKSLSFLPGSRPWKEVSVTFAKSD